MIKTGVLKNWQKSPFRRGGYNSFLLPYVLVVSAFLLTIPPVASFAPAHQQQPWISLSTNELLTSRLIKTSPMINKRLSRSMLLLSTDRTDDYNDIGRDNPTTSGMYNMEKEVLASTQARLDMKRVTDVLLKEDSSSTSSTSSSSIKGSSSSSDQHYTEMMIALASAFVSSLAANLLIHSWFISSIVFVVAFVVASGDPLDEEGIAGPLARIVGRTTLKSIDTAKPKIRAVARAAVFGEEELASLMGRLSELEEENAELRLWVQQRKALDGSSSLLNKVEGSNVGKDIPSAEITKMEKEVLASTQARLDMKQVAKLLLEKESKYSEEQWGGTKIEPTTEPPSAVTIALASAIVASLVTDIFSHSWFISFIVFVAAFVVASRDPLEEEGLAGPVARIVGRTTLESIDTAKPKIRAVARAAVIGEKELASLTAKLSELEQENYDLRFSVQSYLRDDNDVFGQKKSSQNWWD